MQAREAELVAVRKLAEELARGRKEMTTTGHLLAAIASTAGTARDLLHERRLAPEVLLKAARVATDDTPDAVSRAVQRARDFAGRSSTAAPGALHLLFALCHERSTSAYRALEQCGADVAKLRAATMQLATGVVGPRRPQAPPATQALSASPAPHAAPPRSAFPPPPRDPRDPRDSRPALPSRPSAPPPRGNAAPPARGNATLPLREDAAPPPRANAAPPPRANAAPPPRANAAPPPREDAGPPQRADAAPPPRANAAPPPRADAAPPPRATPNDPARRRGRGASAATDAAASRPPPRERFTLDPKLFPTLTQLGRNLTLAAARGELDPVVGRDEEIERTLDVLAKRRANNPCLVGAAGVGKTTVVRGLAQRIAHATTRALDDRIVVEIDPAALLAGTGVRGALAERLAAIRAESRRAGGRVVVFLDEVHQLVAEGGDEATGELKAALARGELPCIAATTIEAYKRHIDGDPSLSRRFTPIEVVELSHEESVLALESAAPAFEKHHGARFAKESLAASVLWSARYLPERALPDKALSILDLAGARARRRQITEVRPEHVAEVVAELAGVPKERLLETDGDRMLRMEELLADRIVGHRACLARIAAVLRRNASGFRSQRPIGTFLLLGPTGVGKTETAKAIAECLFHAPHAMTRLDLSEYAEAHAIARLVGAPPGYVGHESGGLLTEAVRRRPYQVILLDEIEKAHRDVLEAFLQVFDEGRMTDGRGRTVDFSNTVIVLTSNLGADVAVPTSGRGRIGFAATRKAEDVATGYEDAVLQAARAALPPELYNRFDEAMVFAPLTRADVTEVARRMLRALGEELERTRGVHLDVSEAAVEALLDGGGFAPELGARPMRRAIGRMVEAQIADMILRGELLRGDVATVDAEGGAIVVDAVTPTSAPAVGYA